MREGVNCHTNANLYEVGGGRANDGGRANVGGRAKKAGGCTNAQKKKEAFVCTFVKVISGS